MKTTQKTASTAGHVTINDVAKTARVSTATVSRVLNLPETVSSRTASRVMKAVREMGYVPQAAARNLASQRTNTIGLLMPSIGEDFFGQMLRGVEAEVADSGYDLLIATQPENNPGSSSRLPLGKHNTDGIILFTGHIFKDTIMPLYAQHFPIVLLYESPPKDMEIPYVTVENKDGTQKLIDHLIETHGCRNIAFLRGPKGNEDSFWREKGYRDSLTRHGISVREELIIRGEFTEQDSKQAVLEMISKKIDFDAIFGGSDEGAYGAYTALSEAGVKIPEEKIVVGFDDLTLARFLTPALTTVRAPTERVGHEAVKQIMKLLHGGQPDSITLLPTEIVIRRSCGCNGKEGRE